MVSDQQKLASLEKSIKESMEVVRKGNLILEKIKDKKILKYGKDINFITRISDRLFNTYNDLEFFLDDRLRDIIALDLIK